MKEICLTAAVLMALATPVIADTCPRPLEFADRKSELLRALQEARNENAGRFLSRELAEIWATAPNRRAQRLLDAGMALRAKGNAKGAEIMFDQLLAYCPDYAEGYNQRAFLHYMNRDFSAALADLDATLRLSENHVAAMAGKAMTLLQLGRIEEGQALLREAVTLNPWLPERRILTQPPGELL